MDGGMDEWTEKQRVGKTKKIKEGNIWDIYTRHEEILTVSKGKWNLHKNRQRNWSEVRKIRTNPEKTLSRCHSLHRDQTRVSSKTGVKVCR